MKVLLALFAALALSADVAMPLLGWVCDRAGAMRPVHGAAGAFVLGEALVSEVTSVDFDGKSGVAVLAGDEPTRFGFNANGDRTEELPAGASTEAHADGRTLVLERHSIRLELSEDIERIDRLGEGWLAVRTAGAIWAVRTEHGKEQVFRLPEAEQR